MKRFAPLFLIVVLGLASLACMAVNRALFGEPPTPTSIPPTPVPTFTATVTPVPTLTPTPDSCPNGDCITSCLDELRSLPQMGNEQSKTVHRMVTVDKERTLVSYTIDGDQIKNPVEQYGLASGLKDYQKDRQTHELIWNYFAAIIPPAQRKFLSAYIIFTDGKDNLLASVEQSKNSPDKWNLSVDILDAANPKDLTFTLVHEFGHLLTLNPSQVVPSQAIFDHPDSKRIYNEEANACQTYFSGEGCSNSDSYINSFFDQFWPDIYDEWLKVDGIDDEDSYYDALDNFYEKYQDQFVTDYAPTNVAEDAAESFSFFILKPKPIDNSIADQKVLFFYNYPELVQLRSQIGHRLCDQLEK
jgi:hypothetical protein